MKRLCKQLLGKKTKTVEAGIELFKRLLVSREAGRDINLEDILCHELSNTPLSIADTSGKLLSCDNKSDLVAIFEDSATSQSLPDSSLKTITVIDGPALIHKVGKKPKHKHLGVLQTTSLKQSIEILDQG